MMKSAEIRAAFRQIRNSGFRLSTGQLLAMMQAAGVSFQAGMGKSSFAAHRAYYEGNEPLVAHKITSNHEEQLRRFFFDTPLGRSLRSPNSEHAETLAREQLIDTLFSEVAGGKEFAGLYYVLHGSYRYEKQRAIHLMEITHTEQGRLIVIDRINDNKVKPTVGRESSGTMSIINDMPQIITYGKENRIGYSLFVAGRVEKTPQNIEGSHWMFGMLTGITDEGLPFVRKAQIIKRAHAPATATEQEVYESVRNSMLSATGIYSVGGLTQKRSEKTGDWELISKWFDELRHHHLKSAFDDPLQRKVGM